MGMPRLMLAAGGQTDGSQKDHLSGSALAGVLHSAW